ncbi:MAG: carboxypeptidase-like regulatory domain-containing protein, partial [Paludibacter sp.]|nr:carboxypeptidase-like regulatory domain-containing protein [Paludibacter sp.]
MFKKSKHFSKTFFRFSFMLTVLFLAGTNIVAQNKSSDNFVKGTITSTGGDLLVGVSVQLKGTDTGTVTDANGNFSFKVPDYTGTVKISYIGYKTQE